MTNLDQESLFSLELIVDQLSLHHSVECRIPAVAFRLMDFPTLLIYHVEPELAATIRSKLMEDRYRHVPTQLSELKDRKTGAFSIRRGKSCLFCVSPNAMMTSFSSAPLYVMVVDMFPETPKLVGSCGVPLIGCACELYDNIVANGISVPAVQAEKKELDLCNLMGTKLGTVLLGYRILSLGAALLSHIPTQDIIHVKPKEETDQCFYPTTDEFPQSVTEACIAAEHTTNTTGNSERSDNSEVDEVLEKTFADSQTQIEPRSFGSVGTQTSRRRPHTGKPGTQLVRDVDDVITANVVCPPPLFYNSTTCKKTVCWHQEDWASVWEIANDGSSWSDDGTIRMEDKYLDAVEETARNVDFIVKDKPSPVAQNINLVRNDMAMKAPYHPGHMTEFPVLSALMAEILRFQGINLVLGNSGEDANHEHRYRIEKVKRVTKPQKDHEKAAEPKRSAHKCANMLPCHRGPIITKRRSSEPSVCQRPFFAGATKTQKLRLARVNPKLLKEIEAKETERRSQFKAARVSSVRQKENVRTDRQQNANELDALKRIDVSRATEYVSESRESTARYKCPVPTPRTSKMLLSDPHFAAFAEKHVLNDDTSGFGTKTYSVGYGILEPQLIQQSSSEEGIQSTLPPMRSESDHSTCYGQAAITNTTADSNLTDGQVAAHSKLNTTGSDDSDTGPVNILGQTASVSTPVVHKHDSAGSAHLESTDAGGMLSLEDLGLRKIVDHYSGESNDDNDRTEGSNDAESEDRDAEHCSMEENEGEGDRKLSGDSGKGMEPEQLRKVVNQYCDASADDQSELEYEYDFEDTPVQSLRTVSTMNSAASSAMNSAAHHRTGGHEAGTNMKLSSHSRPVSGMGEQCKYSLNCGWKTVIFKLKNSDFF